MQGELGSTGKVNDLSTGPPRICSRMRNRTRIFWVPVQCLISKAILPCCMYSGSLLKGCLWERVASIERELKHLLWGKGSSTIWMGFVHTHKSGCGRRVERVMPWSHWPWFLLIFDLLLAGMDLSQVYPIDICWHCCVGESCGKVWSLTAIAVLMEVCSVDAAILAKLFFHVFCS